MNTRPQEQPINPSLAKEGPRIPAEAEGDKTAGLRHRKEQAGCAGASGCGSMNHRYWKRRKGSNPKRPWQFL